MSEQPSSGPSPTTWIAIAVGGCGCLGVAAVVLLVAAGALFGVRVAPAPPMAPVTAQVVVTPLAPDTAVSDEQLFLQPGQLDGLYLRVQMGSGSITLEHFFFTADGRVVQGVPSGGLDGDVMDRVRTSDVQRYELVGDELVFTDATGKRTEHGFKRLEDGDLELDGLYTASVPLFLPGAKLDGSWGSSASVGAGTGATVSAAWTLAFRPDGTFTSSGVGGTSIETRTGSAGAESSFESEGTYTLSGNTLTLVHADGRTTRHTVYPYGEGEQTARPERVNVDGRMYKREG